MNWLRQMLSGYGRSRLATLVMLAGIAGALAACGEGPRDGGSDRPLIGEPGVYLGPPDQKLTPEQRRQLQERTGLQT
jgi:predicted small lipoprotein YifL